MGVEISRTGVAKSVMQLQPKMRLFLPERNHPRQNHHFLAQKSNGLRRTDVSDFRRRSSRLHSGGGVKLHDAKVTALCTGQIFAGLVA
jgi:hypothetical protein